MQQGLRWLHIVALLAHVADDLLAGLQLACLIAELGECRLELVLVGLLWVVYNGDGLVVNTGDDVAYALLEAQSVLDFVLTVSAVHLWCCGNNERVVVALGAC